MSLQESPCKCIREMLILKFCSQVKMVSLSSVSSSNSRISSALPSRLVALFVGATSGIGEATLKKFAQHAKSPRAYFIGRSQEAADRIVAECQALNPTGQYIFRQADVSLIRVVDEVCEEIKGKEQSINILFLSCGVGRMDRASKSPMMFAGSFWLYES